MALYMYRAQHFDSKAKNDGRRQHARTSALESVHHLSERLLRAVLDWSNLSRIVSFLQSFFALFAFYDDCLSSSEVMLLELPSWNVIVVQVIKLLDAEALHLRHDEENPCNGDEGECTPDESLYYVSNSPRPFGSR